MGMRRGIRDLRSKGWDIQAEGIAVQGLQWGLWGTRRLGRWDGDWAAAMAPQLWALTAWLLQEVSLKVLRKESMCFAGTRPGVTATQDSGDFHHSLAHFEVDQVTQTKRHGESATTDRGPG